MALTLKPKYQIDITGSPLYVTDISGQYDGTNNLGGWGTPNSSLAKSAIVCLVQRYVGTSGTSLVSISSRIVYDPTAAENKQTQFTFNTGLDGHIKVTLFRLPVSLDGTTNQESQALASGDIFYWSSGSQFIWKMVGSTPTAITVESLLAEGSVVKAFCEDIMFPQLAIKLNSLYRTYAAKRTTDCNAAEDLFQELLHLRTDLYGAKILFRSGLSSLAEDTINTLLKKYDLAV